ncbi:MarR family winged helix-turn-helix transcriptional regulator [Microcella humidisoli]|uniref:MarR family transcriptional regulator n=1 Tax=Microcella humidisoli TaxID=2963406 RepID=A0ABY5FZC0_9MICO|nr:MarR family transcriptional regulator [Microcella humidisoli]UTT63676.1 MarR family transcriptional regulator [Microcella humidisoli]
MSTEAEQAWRAIYRAYMRMAPTIDKELKKLAGLTYSEYEVLAQLKAAAGPMKMAELASHVAVTRTHASRLIESLKDAGLATHEKNPYDGRSFLVAITTEGLRRLQESASAVESVFAESVGSFVSASELSQLTAWANHAVANDT